MYVYVYELYLRSKDKLFTCSGSGVCIGSILSISILFSSFLEVLCGGTLWITETLVGGSTRGVFGGVCALGNAIFSDLDRNCGGSSDAIGGLLYSFRSARVSTWRLLPYGTSPPRMLEMNLLGGGLVALVAGCGGDGDGAGLLLRKDSGVVARSSSVLSRSSIAKRKTINFMSIVLTKLFAKTSDHVWVSST